VYNIKIIILVLGCAGEWGVSEDKEEVMGEICYMVETRTRDTFGMRENGIENKAATTDRGGKMYVRKS